MIMANMKAGKGLRVTGIGAVFCVHGLFCANAVGALIKGERYVDMGGNMERTGTETTSDSARWTSYWVPPCDG